MEPIKRNDTGAAVEDVQTRLARIGHLPEDAITGIFDDATAAALAEFLAASALPPSEEVTEKVWAALVDATYNLGDRTLYLRMPYFHGHDVLELQQALGALGFFYGTRDAIFGAHTEEALRRFQLNLGLPSDGIADAALRNRRVGKEAAHSPAPFGLRPCGRRAQAQRRVPVWHRRVLPGRGLAHVERGSGRNPPPRSSAPTRSRCRRTRPLLVLLLSATDAGPGCRWCPMRKSAGASSATRLARVSVLLPGTMWLEAGPERSAQHYAITLLDALCSALQGVATRGLHVELW